jgi:transposase
MRSRTMAGKRRVFGPAFKAKVALAAAKGDRTTAQLASQFGIHTSQVTAWKKQLMAQVAAVPSDQPVLEDELHVIDCRHHRDLPMGILYRDAVSVGVELHQ